MSDLKDRYHEIFMQRNRMSNELVKKDAKIASLTSTVERLKEFVERAGEHLTGWDWTVRSVGQLGKDAQSLIQALKEARAL